MTEAKTITLYFRNGTSDKVYRIDLLESEGGWKVNYSYGRRGDTPRPGTKTKTPLPYDAARKIYERVLREQLTQGYTPGEDGVPFQDTCAEERNTGILPQLLNPIESHEVDYFLANSDYVSQEKFDGKRILIRNTANAIEGINRSGLVVPLPKPIADSAKINPVLRPTAFIIDGELLGERYMVFDVLEAAGRNLRDLPYAERLETLTEMSYTLGEEIALVETAWGSAKRAFFNQLQESEKEGCVFKNRFAIYSAGRPATGGDQRKFKFYETASFLVSGQNNQRSVSLSLFDTNQQLVPAGNVTIPPNFDIPAIGDVVEARFLYAYAESGSIYQPVFLGRRDDIPRENCSTQQLKYKASPK